MKYCFPATAAKIRVGRGNREAPISWMKYVIEIKVGKFGT
jgi:hypothetical protein